MTAKGFEFNPLVVVHLQISLTSNSHPARCEEAVQVAVQQSKWETATKGSQLWLVQSWHFLVVILACPC